MLGYANYSRLRDICDGKVGLADERQLTSVENDRCLIPHGREGPIDGQARTAASAALRPVAHLAGTDR